MQTTDGIQLLRQAFRTRNIKDSAAIYKKNQWNPQLSGEDHSRMLGFLAQHRIPSHAAQFASNVIHHLGNHGINMRDHRMYMTILLRANEHYKLLDYLETMRYQFKEKPDIRCYNILMASFMQNKMYQNVIDTWQNCVTAWPGSKYVNLDGWAFLLEAHGHLKDVKSVVQLYNHLDSNANVSHNSQIQEARIRAFGLCNLINEAIYVFEVKVQVCKDPLDMYDAIMEACVNSNQDDLLEFYWLRTMEYCNSRNNILDIETSVNQKPSSSKPLPCSVTRILEFYNRKQQYQHVLDIFYEIYPKYPFEPLSFEYCCHALWNLGEKNRAQEMVYEMTCKKLKTTPQLFNAIKTYRKSHKRPVKK
jgi:hypothetical protein